MCSLQMTPSTFLRMRIYMSLYVERHTNYYFRSFQDGDRERPRERERERQREIHKYIAEFHGGQAR